MVQRLSIISIVPKEYFKEIDRIKRLLCNYSHSYASLQFPPHITLAHIKTQEGELESILKKIGKISRNLKECKINVTGISCKTYMEKGKEKYQVKFDIEQNPQLIEVHRKLKELNELDKSGLGGSNYHITLVFGDLTEKNYLKLQNYLSEHRELNKKFTYLCDDLSVLAREEKDWKIIKKFKI